MSLRFAHAQTNAHAHAHQEKRKEKDWQSYLCLGLPTQSRGPGWHFKCLHQSRKKAVRLPGWLLHPLASLHMSTVPGRSCRTKPKNSGGYQKKKEGGLFFKVRRESKQEPLSKSVSVSYIEKCFAPPPLLRTVWCLSGSDKAAFWAVLFLGTHLSLIVEDLMVSENTKKGKKQNCKPIMCAVGEKWHSGAALYVIYICAIPQCQLPICFFMAFCHSFSSACTLIPAGQTQRLHPSFFCHRLPCTQGCYDQSQLSWGQGRVEPWTSLWTAHVLAMF